eukprot:Skav211291  [mRNA]  locus=scaffold2429:195949:198323:+ [translate_table: standard]
MRRTFSCWALLLSLAVAVMSLCFPDGIPESQRVNLTNSEGESFAVGMWVPTWAAGVSVSAATWRPPKQHPISTTQ